MKVNFALLLAASGYVAGHAGMQFPQDPAGHEWRRTSSDSRSPCPGLNILANHGYLPRDGRNINKTILSTAATEAYGFPAHFNDFVVDEILRAGLQTTGTNNTFHLGDLSLPASHNVCEFDGSLSRGDTFFGDASHFDIGVWYRTGSRLGLYDLNYDHQHVFGGSNGGNGTFGNGSSSSTANPGPTAYVSVETAALAQAAHYREAMAANKEFTVGVVNGSIGTSAFYMYTMWDDAAQAAPKSWVRSFFEEERIPYKYGFPSPGAPKRADHMKEITQQIYDITMGV